MDIMESLERMAALRERGVLNQEEFEEQKAALLAQSRRTNGGSRGSDAGAGLSLGSVVGNYEVLEQIGEGGMATVYRVRHRFLDSIHALKVLHPELARDEGIRDRFLSEGKIQANLRHPNIIRVTDLVAEPGVAGLVAEHIDGLDMSSWIEKRGGTTDAERIREIFIPVAEALAIAHKAGVIHRDVKPSNILLSTLSGGGVHPTVLDFGIARVVGDGPGQRKSATRTGAQIGTVAYMSPEQLKGARDLDLRTDVFGLAATLYEFTTGEPPFSGATDFEVMTAITRGSRVPISERVPDLAPGIAAAVNRGLEPERQKRPESASEFAQLLSEPASSRPDAAEEPGSPGDRQPNSPVGVQFSEQGSESSGWMIRNVAGVVCGPFDEARVVSGIRIGSFQPFEFVASSREGPWSLLADHPRFAAAFRGLPSRNGDGWLVRRTDGEVLGPFTEDCIAQWHATGRGRFTDASRPGGPWLEFSHHPVFGPLVSSWSLGLLDDSLPDADTDTDTGSVIFAGLALLWFVVVVGFAAC
jgi:serine/threonine protein kinase